MATVIKMGGGGPKKDDQRPAGKRAAGSAADGLRSAQVSPGMAVLIVLALVVVVASIWFGVSRAGSAAANTPMMDTSSETPTGSPEQHANGMDTSTSSSTGAAGNNGMDTGTGR